MLQIAWLPSPNFSRRLPTDQVRYLIIHYTECDLALSLDILTKKESVNPVSAHYVIDELGRIWQLVDEAHKAWHAGESQWGQDTGLNAVSIGIELVNDGCSGYPLPQMEALATLAQQIVHRHQILPQHVLGHSDIAPQRKVDPGPLFDWSWLAQRGVGVDPKVLPVGMPDPKLNMTDLRGLLAEIGYAIPPLTGDAGRDQASLAQVIKAFQMHYLPHQFTGNACAETVQKVQSLHRYCQQQS